MLLVSHDRDFLDRLVTSVIAFEDSGRLRNTRAATATCCASGRRRYRQNLVHGEVLPGEARWAEDTAACPHRAQRDLDRLIGQIEILSVEIGRLERELGNSDLYRRDRRTFEDLTARLTRTRVELDTAEQRWLDLAGQLEQVSD